MNSQEKFRRFTFNNAMKNGGKSIDEHQLYSGEPYRPYIPSPITKDPKQFKDEALMTLEAIEMALDMDPQVVDDYEHDIVDITYLDAKFNGHIVHLKDDPEFLAAAEKLKEEAGAVAILGIKWDGQHSPVFMAKRELPEILGYENECPISPSGSGQAGIICCNQYRYVDLGVYFWIEGELYDDYFQFECHDGALYPVLAFPDLPAKDGLTEDKIAMFY